MTTRLWGQARQLVGIAVAFMLVSACANPFGQAPKSEPARVALAKAEEQHPEAPLLVPVKLPTGYKFDNISPSLIAGKAVATTLTFISADSSGNPVTLCVQVVGAKDDPCGALNAPKSVVRTVEKLVGVWQFITGDTVAATMWADVSVTHDWTGLDWVAAAP